MSNEDELTRRGVLKMTGVSLAGITAATGVASARADHAGERGPPDHAGEQGPPDHAKATGWLKKKGNRVELDVTEARYKNMSASMVEGVPDNARRIPFEAIKLQVQTINEAVESNRMKVQNSDNGITLKWRGKPNLEKRGIDQ